MGTHYFQAEGRTIKIKMDPLYLLRNREDPVEDSVLSYSRFQHIHHKRPAA